jgi:hypothetical protein
MTFSGALEQLMQLVASVLGLTAMPDLSTMQIAVLTVAVAVLAVTALAVGLTLLHPDRSGVIAASASRHRRIRSARAKRPESRRPSPSKGAGSRARRVTVRS